MSKRSKTCLHHALIAVISALVYGLAFWLNDVFTSWLLFKQGVALIYLPAGVKLLALLIGGWPAAVGVGLTWWALSFGFWPQLSAPVLLGAAAISAGSTWLVLHVWLRVWRMGRDLKHLNFSRLLWLDASASVIHGWLMNGYYFGVGARELSEVPSTAWGMALGDFMGSGLTLLGLIMALRWSPLRHRLSNR